MKKEVVDKSQWIQESYYEHYITYDSFNHHNEKSLELKPCHVGCTDYLFEDGRLRKRPMQVPSLCKNGGELNRLAFLRLLSAFKMDGVKIAVGPEKWSSLRKTEAAISRLAQKLYVTKFGVYSIKFDDTVPKGFRWFMINLIRTYSMNTELANKLLITLGKNNLELAIRLILTMNTGEFNIFRDGNYEYEGYDWDEDCYDMEEFYKEVTIVGFENSFDKMLEWASELSFRENGRCDAIYMMHSGVDSKFLSRKVLSIAKNDKKKLKEVDKLFCCTTTDTYKGHDDYITKLRELLW